jgi:hypothetical protein
MYNQRNAINSIPYAKDNISLIEIKKDYDTKDVLLPFRILDTRTKVKEQINIAEKSLKDGSFH